MSSPPSNWLLELLSVIRIRAGMFIGGDESAGALSVFIGGFSAGMFYRGEPGADGHALLDDFETWLRAKYSEHGAVGWPGIIEQRFETRPDLWPSEFRRSRSKTDGSTRLFFIEFDEFLDARGISLDARPDLIGRFFRPLELSAGSDSA